MKKLFFLIVFAGLAIGIFYSCKKDVNQEPESNISVEQQLNNNIWNNIVRFQEKINLSNRDIELFTPDSALWYLEALYNVEQVTDTNYNYLDIDTSYYTLVPDENGLVDLQQLSDVYDLMVNDLVENLQSKNSEYTYLIIGDLSILGANRDNTINMQLLSGIGINPIICYEAFTADDDWYYGNLLGREDGQYLWQSDAGQELQKRYNNPINCFTQGGGYWVSVVQRTANWSEYPNYMFNEQSATPPIINDTDMKYYL
ncbi:MAG: hypothetical protein C0598_06375 [Marinilabiliales bacterium]|nr:MAG: hypothetical protein C0598_06375 [Marinilabiliales bacterium]